MKTVKDLTNEVLHHLIFCGHRSYSSIAREFNTTKETVRHRADKAGFSRSSRQARPLVREELERMFCEGRSDQEMADYFQVGLRRLQALRIGMGMTRAYKQSNPGAPSAADDIRWLAKIREQERHRPNHVFTSSSIAGFASF